MKEFGVASYNLHHSRNQARLLQNIQALKQANINLFCLQEMRAANGDEFFGDKLLRHLGPHWQSRNLLSPESRNDFGLVIIWNSNLFTLTDYQVIEFPVLPKLSPLEWFIERYLLSGEARPVKRAAQIAAFNYAGTSLRLVNYHADWHGGFPHRIGQVGILKQKLSDDYLGPEILCGDFNTIGWLNRKEQIQKIQTILGPEYTNLFPEFVPTSYHGQHLDYMFARGCEIIETKVHRMLGSDHFPVTAWLSVKTD